ncbi:MAG: CYTH domain-containing protein, partial [Tepidimonas sp.]|uniref:CYTH domain-containing protein n=1 Tax=Tepidimonas sp. TaxID=2002775 RepID=UPI00405524AE
MDVARLAQEQDIVPQEIELKFALPGWRAEQALQRLRSHPLLRRRAARQQRLLNRYYDTPDGWLRDLHCALRVRGIETRPAARDRAQRSARTWEPTLKTAGSARGALSVR